MGAGMMGLLNIDAMIAPMPIIGLLGGGVGCCPGLFGTGVLFGGGVFFGGGVLLGGGLLFGGGVFLGGGVLFGGEVGF